VILQSDDLVRIRTIIIDDEPLARSNIKVLLRGNSEVEIITECGSGVEAVQEIRRTKPDLLFLDVQMPECDGFDVLELLGSELPAAIIFVTAYDEYALRAFEAGALDYLLKPFDNARFERTLRRAKERIIQLKGQPRGVERLAIKSAGQVSFIAPSQIDWIEAADYYSCLHVGTRSHLLRRSLSDLERELDSERFARIHRSTIVNLEQVRSMRLDETGEYEVYLENGARLRLSRRYRKNFQSRLGVRTPNP
jgi:two-component system LytT family response regulator